MKTGTLAGMRVIEASAFVAAPLGGMTLAQMGADVIRIDLPTGGLDYRRWPINDKGTSLFWCGLNKHKRSVCIDFTRPEGRELAMALIAAPGEDAGLLLTNLPPRSWLSFEQLASKRSDLIQLTVQGNRHGAAAVDYTVNPSVGIPLLTGPAGDDVPVNHVLPAWDLITGQMAATGLLAAERHRYRTGEGQHVTLALEDVALAMLANLGFIAEAEQGAVRERIGNYLFGAFGGDFVTADGQRIMVVALTLKQWNALCSALELQSDVDRLQRDLGMDLSLEGNRFRAREAIAALVRSRIEKQTAKATGLAFDEHGVCWSAYRSVKELVTDDPSCSAENPLFAIIEQPGVGKTLAPTVPLTFSRQGRERPASAPQLGQHTAQVLTEILKLSDSAIGQLFKAGIIGSAVVADTPDRR